MNSQELSSSNVIFDCWATLSSTTVCELKKTSQTTTEEFNQIDKDYHPQVQLSVVELLPDFALLLRLLRLLVNVIVIVIKSSNWHSMHFFLCLTGDY